jgi:hypothetical protein
MQRIEINVSTGEQILIDLTPEEQLEFNEKLVLQAKEQPKILLKAKIAALEATITPRRTREAILGIDTTWLADVELQIGQLRQQLSEL